MSICFGRWRRIALLGCALASLAAAGCDESFEPIAPGAVDYSVWGLLRPGQDRQWIRVMPIRPVATTTPDESDIHVTLENLGTGEVFELHDSVFSFPSPEGSPVYTHNYWTDAPVRPGDSFHFTARREGHPPAEADVLIPPDSAFVVSIDQQGTLDRFRFEGVPGYAFLSIWRRGFNLCGSAGGAVDGIDRADSTWVEDGDVVLSVRRYIIVSTCGPLVVQKRALDVDLTGLDWPSQLELAPGVLGDELLDSSNIENALGFLAGIHHRTVPWERCEFAGAETSESVPDFCSIRYDSRSARLTGTVTEAGSVEPIGLATVRLRELDGEPAAHRKTRPAFADTVGVFEIGGLDPGTRYELTVRAEELASNHLGPDEVYEEYADTVVFSPGEERNVDIELVQREEGAIR